MLFHCTERERVCTLIFANKKKNKSYTVINIETGFRLYFYFILFLFFQFILPYPPIFFSRCIVEVFDLLIKIVAYAYCGACNVRYNNDMHRRNTRTIRDKQVNRNRSAIRSN